SLPSLSLALRLKRPTFVYYRYKYISVRPPLLPAFITISKLISNQNLTYYQNVPSHLLPHHHHRRAQARRGSFLALAGCLHLRRRNRRPCLCRFRCCPRGEIFQLPILQGKKFTDITTRCIWLICPSLGATLAAPQSSKSAPATFR